MMKGPIVSYGPVDQLQQYRLRKALDNVRETQGGTACLTLTAHEVGVHPVHLAPSFRRFLGCTFGHYLATVRLRKACELLLTTETPIADVAHACGFADHAHLCRSFKEATGRTPTAFRCAVPPSRSI